MGKHDRSIVRWRRKRQLKKKLREKRKIEAAKAAKAQGKEG